MNRITSLNNFQYNLDDIIYSNNSKITIVISDSVYYLDDTENMLYNKYNKIEITKEIKDYIIDIWEQLAWYNNN